MTNSTYSRKNLLFAPRVSLAVAAIALTLGFAGCKSSVPVADDATLTSTIQGKLASDGALAGEAILASVEKGVVTLNGTVSSQAARSLAASDASQVTGIRTVVNNLTLKSSASAPVVTAAVAPPVALAPPPPSREKVSKPSAAPAPRAARASQPNYQPAPTDRHAPAEPVQQAPPPPAQAAAPTFRTVTVPAGSTLPIRITQTLDSATTQQGETFTGALATDVIVDGLIALPQGTPVTGRVSAVQEAGHYKGSSLLTIELTTINARSGRLNVTTEPFSKQGAGRGKNTAEKVGGGAAVGAILGGIFGGGKGAAIGAAAGGGLGAGANTITRGQQVQIPTETMVRFRLETPIAIRVSTRDSAGRNSDNGVRNPDNTDTPSLGRRPLEPSPQQ